MKKQLLVATIATAMVFHPLLPTYTEAAPSISGYSKEMERRMTDVPPTHYGQKYITHMTEQGIIKGYPDGTFKPNLSISREHVALMFYRAFDLANKEPVREGTDFKDVSKNHMYYDEIQAVYQAGIFDGKDGNSFDPTAPMTRAEMAKVIVTAFDLERHTGYIFKDVGEKHWAKDYIATLYAHGIAKGSNGNYMPNEPVKRADFSILLYNSLNPDEVVKPTEPLKPNPVTPPVEEKPVDTKPTKPVTPPSDTTTGYIYENTKVKDIPRPEGYVENVTEDNNLKEMEKWAKENQAAYHGVFPIDKVYVEEKLQEGFYLKEFGHTYTTYKGYLEYKAQSKGLTLDELVSLINEAVKTGKLVSYEKNGIQYKLFYAYVGGLIDMVQDKPAKLPK